MTDDELKNDHIHQQVLALYQHSAEELRFLKQLGWQTVYYILLIDSALVAIGRFGELGPGEQRIIPWLLKGVALFGVWHIFISQRDMTKYRNRIRRVRQRLSDVFGKVLKSKEPQKDNARWWHQCTIPLLLMGAVFLACWLSLKLVPHEPADSVSEEVTIDVDTPSQ